MPTTSDLAPKRDIFTVSRLTGEVRRVLEGSFPLIWVEGEISNLAQPSSGHIYFSLKDPDSQVRCAMFRMKRQQLRFQPDNGMRVLMRARVSLYEARGDFQLIAEQMEPAGEGALQQAFDELKQRLDKEGLFDTAHKKPLPALPHRIGVITSSSGAAIRDVLSVLKRRFPAIQVVLYPIPVQGNEAPGKISEMIHLADRRAECDLLIITRGGGSLEDLMAFNDEGVARAIHAADTPIVSAVGHEIDFTIADFVADRRAPTPSAAAELASPDQDELEQRFQGLLLRLLTHTRQEYTLFRRRLTDLQRRFTRLHPSLWQQQRLDELEQRLARGVGVRRQQHQTGLATLHARLLGFAPSHRLAQFRQQTLELRRRLTHSMGNQLQRRQQEFASATRSLHTLSPLATLGRGYAISWKLPEREILRDVSQVAPGDHIKIRLAKGKIISRVESCSDKE